MRCLLVHRDSIRSLILCSQVIVPILIVNTSEILLGMMAVRVQEHYTAKGANLVFLSALSGDEIMRVREVGNPDADVEEGGFQSWIMI